jgi:hypothetical protein
VERCQVVRDTLDVRDRDVIGRQERIQHAVVRQAAHLDRVLDDVPIATEGDGAIALHDWQHGKVDIGR